MHAVIDIRIDVLSLMCSAWEVPLFCQLQHGLAGPGRDDGVFTLRLRLGDGCRAGHALALLHACQHGSNTKRQTAVAAMQS